MDPTQLVRQASPIDYPVLQRGVIAPSHAAPATFSEPVWVILPEGSSEHLYGPCAWPAIHGTAKPQPGAACVVGFDEQNQPTVLWWEGKQTEHQLAAPGGMVARATGSKLLVSATHDAFVTASVWFKAEAGTVHFKVAGTEVAVLNSSVEQITACAFPVAAGLEWEGAVEGKIKELLASYTLVS